MTLDVGMAWADLSDAQVRMSERMRGLRCIPGRGRRTGGTHHSGWGPGENGLALTTAGELTAESCQRMAARRRRKSTGGFR